VLPVAPFAPAGPIGPREEELDETGVEEVVAGTNVAICVNRSKFDPVPSGRKTRTFVGLTPLIRIETSYAQLDGVRRGLSVVGSSRLKYPAALSVATVGPLKTTVSSGS
jgi:hypothetical protein